MSLFGWINSQPLFIQIAAGIIAALAVLAVFNGLMLLLANFGIGMQLLGDRANSWLRPSRNANPNQDFGPPVAIESQEEFVKAVMEALGKTEEQVSRYLEAATADEVLALANKPDVRFIIKRSRERRVTGG